MKTIKLFGVAGSGKTTKCLELIKQFLQQGYSIQDICFTTYTKAGIRSIKEKLEQENIFLPDQNYFNTLHSLCWRLAELSNPLKYEKFFEKHKIPYTHDEEDKKTLGELIEETFEHIQNIYCKRIEAYNEKELMQFIHKKFKDDENISIYEKKGILQGLLYLIQYKKETQTHTYSDSLIEVLENKIDIPVKILIVDEAQDLFPAQIEIVKSWIQNFQKEIFVICGDDDQTLHTYAGSNANFLIDFNSENQETIILEQSYRCPIEVCILANKILQKINKRQGKKILPIQKKGHVQWIDFPKNIEEILKLIQKDKKTFILFRTNRLKKSFGEELFSRSDTPFTYLGQKHQSFYSLKYCLIHNAIFKLSDKQTITFEEACKLISVIPASFLHKRIKTKFEKENNLEFVSFDYFAKNIIKWGLMIHSSDFNVKEELVKIIQYQSLGRSNLEISLNKNDLVKNRLLLSSYIINYKKSFFGETRVTGVAETPLQIGTFHSSKGLEAENVLIFLGTNKFFSKIDDSELRCLYVAVTRSTNFVFLINSYWFNEEAYLADYLSKLL